MKNRKKKKNVLNKNLGSTSLHDCSFARALAVVAIQNYARSIKKAFVSAATCKSGRAVGVSFEPHKRARVRPFGLFKTKSEVTSWGELVSLILPLMNLLLMLGVHVDCDLHDGDPELRNPIRPIYLSAIQSKDLSPTVSLAHTESDKFVVWQLRVGIFSTDCRDFITQHSFR